MVSVQQAREQIAAQRRLIRTARLPSPTPTALRQRGRQQLAQRGKREQQLAASKKEALRELEPISKRIEAAAGRQKAAEELQRDIETAKKAAEAGQPLLGESRRVQKFFQLFSRRELAGKRSVEIATEFKKLGLTPKFVGGELRGFEGQQVQQSFELKDLPQVQPEAVANLERIGLIKVEEFKTNGSLDTRPILDVQASPSFRDKLKKEIKRRTPELPLGGGSLDNLVEDALGIVIGGGITLKSEAVQRLTDLRNARGERIFQQNQAEGIVDLSTEIALNKALGTIAGKVLTGATGAALKLVPKAIKESPKFQKVINLLNLGGALGLTAVELVNIQKTFRNEGQKAAVLRLVGSASFAAGFTKTGFRGTAQAEKEFDALARSFKKRLVKNKKGQVTLLRRKKKKKKLSDLDETTLDDLENQVALEGAIERELAKTTNLKEQFDILSRIKSKLKTPVQKANFKKFTENLVEKQLIKFPKVEIVEGKIITPRFRPTKKGIVATSPSKARNDERIRKNNERNQKRIDRAKKPLGERFQEAKGLQRAVGGFGLTEAQIARGRGRVDEFEEVVPLSKQLNILKVQNAQARNQLFNQIARARSALHGLVASRASTSLISNQRQLLLSLNKQLSKQSLQSQQKVKSLLASATKTAQQTKQVQRQKTKQALLLKSRLQSKQRLKQLLRPGLKPRRPRRGKPRKPIKPFLPFLPSLPFGEGKKKKVKKKVAPVGKKKFDVFVRRFGKDVKVDSARTKKKAGGLLRKRLEVTLRASGKIFNKQTKKFVTPKLAPGFRRSKVDSKRLVERRSKRLSSGKERKDIQAFKKLAKPKIEKRKRRKK